MSPSALRLLQVGNLQPAGSYSACIRAVAPCGYESQRSPWSVAPGWYPSYLQPQGWKTAIWSNKGLESAHSWRKNWSWINAEELYIYHDSVSGASFHMTRCDEYLFRWRQAFFYFAVFTLIWENDPIGLDFDKSSICFKSVISRTHVTLIFNSIFHSHFSIFVEFALIPCQCKQNWSPECYAWKGGWAHPPPMWLGSARLGQRNFARSVWHHWPDVLPWLEASQWFSPQPSPSTGRWSVTTAVYKSSGNDASRRAATGSWTWGWDSHAQSWWPISPHTNSTSHMRSFDKTPQES